MSISSLTPFVLLLSDIFICFKPQMHWYWSFKLVNYIVERFWKSVFYIYSHIHYLTNHTYHYHIFTYIDTIPSGLHSFLKKLYWTIVDLECCVDFCCIAKWLSCTHAYNLFYFFPLWFITGYWNIVPYATHDDLVFCPSFLLIDLKSMWYYFLSSWITSFNISCISVWLAINSLGFCLSETFFSFLKHFLLGIEF